MSDSRLPPSPALIPLQYRITLILFLAVIAVIVSLARIEPAWAKRVMDGVCAGGILYLIILNPIVAFFTRLNHGGLELRLETITTEQNGLEEQRSQVERVLMAYGELQEFPDFVKLSSYSWQNRSDRERDEHVRELLEAEANRALERFSGGVYWEEEIGEFKASHLFGDLLAFSESIARVYAPESKQALLELDLERLLKAVNRASIQLILLLEDFSLGPLKLKTMNLGKVVRALGQASTAFKSFRQVEEYISSHSEGAKEEKKLFDSINPLAAIATEIIKQVVKESGSKAFSALSLRIIREVLAIIAWETVDMYDPAYRYRTPDWVYGVELIHLVSLAEETPEILREALEELNTLALRSSYDQAFLYRCAALNASPRPDAFIQPEVISYKIRGEIRDQLENFLIKHMKNKSSLSEEMARHWQEGLHHRLGLKLDQEKRIVRSDDPSDEGKIKLPSKIALSLRKAYSRIRKRKS